MARKKNKLSFLTEFTRSIVFGMEDGLVSNLGVVFAVWVAGAGQNTILLAGLASLFAGSLSMSAGSFLSSKSQREVYEAEIARTKKMIAKNPNKACNELCVELKKEGFDADEIEIMSNHFLEHNEDTFIQNYIQKRLKLNPERFDHPVKNGLAMFLAFSLGGLFPVFPFFFAAGFRTIVLSGVLAISMLFIVGVVKSKVSHRDWIKSGLEMVILGAGAGAIGYLVGLVFSSMI